MASPIQTRLDDLTEAFLNGRISDILRYYSQELTVFCKDGLLQFSGQREIAQAIVKHRERAFDGGMVSLRGEIFARPIVQRGRYKIYVRWHYNMGNNLAPRIAENAYYCTGPSGHEMVEVIEFRQLAFPDAMSWYGEQNLYCTKARVAR